MIQARVDFCEGGSSDQSKSEGVCVLICLHDFISLSMLCRRDREAHCPFSPATAGEVHKINTGNLVTILSLTEISFFLFCFLP